MTIINCPHCQSDRTRNNGKTSSGTQRYRCNDCNKSFTLTPVGRPCLGEVPLTNYERVKRHRQKLSNSSLSNELKALVPSTDL